jgi:Tfp pilus assembly protein PilO
MINPLDQLKKSPKSVLKWGSLSALLLVFIILVVFLRMIVHGKQRILNELKQKAHEERALIAHAQKLDTGELRSRLAQANYRLISTNHMSDVLAEINEIGKAQGVEIISITPAEGGQNQNPSIQLEVEGSYQNVAEFLGELDELKTSAMVVNNFKLGEKQGEGVLQLNLSLGLYGEEGTGGEG